jgi:hypothetical protein
MSENGIGARLCKWARANLRVCLFLLLAVVSVALMIYLGMVGEPLATFEAPLGIISFESPDDAADSSAMIKSWEDAGVTDYARRSLWWDFALAVAYSTTFALAWLLISSSVAQKFTFWRSLTCLAAMAMWAAGILDCIENGILLRMLSNPDGITDPLARAVWWCAAVKFALVFLLGVPGFVIALTVHEALRHIYNRTLRPWFEWIARYPLLIVVVAVIYFVTKLPDPQAPGLGLQYLFWHDQFEIQFWAAALLSPLILYLCFVGYLLDADDNWVSQPKHATQTTPTSSPLPNVVAGSSTQIWSLLKYLFWTAGPLMGLLLCRAMRVRMETAAVVAISFAATLATLVVLYVLSYSVYVYVIKQIKQGKLRAVRRLCRRWKEYYVKSRWVRIIFKLPIKNPPLAWLHVVSAYLLTIVLIELYVVFSKQSSPAIAIWVVLAAGMAIYGRFVYMFPKRYFGWIAALLIAGMIFAGASTYSHQFEGLEDYYATPKLVRLGEFDKPPAADAETPATEVELEDDFALVQAWRTQHSATKPKLVVVTVSGGGIRAAVWSMVVLTHLERQHEDFPQHVRLITGTSGGMLGATYYVVEYPNSGAPRDDAVRQQLVENISQDSLSAAAWALVARDIPTLGYAPNDRGHAIERRWREMTSDEAAGKLGLKMKLSELAQFESQGLRPSLVFSPMLVEDGRRLLISNVDLKDLTSTSARVIGNNGPSQQEFSRTAVQFFRLFPNSHGKLMLSTAVRMNASFPYITPAGVLPTIPPRRVADAGYYDNYGVNVAALWIDNLVRTRRAWLAENLSGIVLVQINDHPTEHNRNNLRGRDERPQSQFAQGQNWLTTPFSAVMSARNATMQFRNDEQIQQLDRLINGDSGDGDFFSTVTFEFTGHASLSWYLARSEVKQLRYCMEGDTVEKLSEQLKYEIRLPGAEFDLLEEGRQQNAKRLNQLIELLKAQ